MSLPFIITSSLAEKNKDETRRMNEVLFLELETLQREYKRSRQVVEQLTKDYEESKDLDPVRRYEKLKVMVKRTIMHFKVNSEEQIKEAAAAAACQGTQAEALKRRGEKNTRISTMFRGLLPQQLLYRIQLAEDIIRRNHVRFRPLLLYRFNVAGPLLSEVSSALVLGACLLSPFVTVLIQLWNVPRYGYFPGGSGHTSYGSSTRVVELLSL